MPRARFRRPMGQTSRYPHYTLWGLKKAVRGQHKRAHILLHTKGLSKYSLEPIMSAAQPQ